MGELSSSGIPGYAKPPTAIYMCLSPLLLVLPLSVPRITHASPFTDQDLPRWIGSLQPGPCLPIVPPSPWPSHYSQVPVPTQEPENHRQEATDSCAVWHSLNRLHGNFSIWKSLCHSLSTHHYLFHCPRDTSGPSVSVWKEPKRGKAGWVPGLSQPGKKRTTHHPGRCMCPSLSLPLCLLVPFIPPVLGECQGVGPTPPAGSQPLGAPTLTTLKC